VHLDTGFPGNSWSAEVRAVVDGDYAVIKRWRKHKGWFGYFILDRLEVQTWNERKDTEEDKGFFLGPLPKRTET
jgi:hypothetical protein